MYSHWLPWVLVMVLSIAYVWQADALSLLSRCFHRLYLPWSSLDFSHVYFMFFFLSHLGMLAIISAVSLHLFLLSFYDFHNACVGMFNGVPSTPYTINFSLLLIFFCYCNLIISTVLYSSLLIILFPAQICAFYWVFHATVEFLRFRISFWFLFIISLSVLIFTTWSCTTFWIAFRVFFFLQCFID